MGSFFPPTPYGYGGDRQVQAFIDKELVYPKSALNNSIEGIVAIFFVVDTSGNTSDIRIVNSVNPEVDKEALRLFNKLQWHPSNKYGTKYPCEHIYRVNFDIGKYKKACKKRGYQDLTYPDHVVDTTNTIYHFSAVKELPSPMVKGQATSLPQYIKNNLDYPEEAYRKTITGTVKLEYVVEPSGNVSNIRAVEHVGGGCTDEAARLISSVRWAPGISEGKVVRTKMLTEITFDIPAKAGPNSYSY